MFNLKKAGLSNFTVKVLTALNRVPQGKVVTYATLAKAVGSPRSARAVGNALHSNPFAPGIPCHRVIKSDGTLGGYGRGQQAKLNLLKHEGVAFNKNLTIKDPVRILTTL